jgi:hypothetical protein
MEDGLFFQGNSGGGQATFRARGETVGWGLGAVLLDEADQVGALAEPGKVEGVGKLARRPAAGAEEFFDYAVEPGLGGFFEQRQGFARTFGDTNAFAGFDPFLEREEVAFLDEVQELFEVFWQGSATCGHDVPFVPFMFP